MSSPIKKIAVAAAVVASRDLAKKAVNRLENSGIHPNSELADNIVRYVEQQLERNKLDFTIYSDFNDETGDLDIELRNSEPNINKLIKKAIIDGYKKFAGITPFNIEDSFKNGTYSVCLSLNKRNYKDIAKLKG